MFEKSSYKNATKAIRITRKNQDVLPNLEQYFRLNNVILEELPESSWIITEKATYDIKQKVEQQGVKIIDWNLKINRGILTGYNDAFIISGDKKNELIEKDPKSADILKPILRGRDVKKYFYEYEDLWLIGTFPSKNINIEDYPAIKEYLQSFGNRLEQSGKTDCRKKTTGKWFETQDSIAYWEEFEKPKILYSDITKYLWFTLDKESLFTNDRCYLITGENLEYLSSFLNSQLFRFVFAENFPELQGNSKKMLKVIFEQIPVKQISADLQQPFIEKVNEILAIKKADAQADTTHLEADIDQMVYELYGLTDEEIAIVEGWE
jgi:hypothetical protein